MGWRTVVITRQCKLDYCMGMMNVRGEDRISIPLEDISVLIIENPAATFTGCLLNELMFRKVKVIFCDDNHLPFSELIPHHGSHDSSLKLRLQISWDESFTKLVWREIVHAKIQLQADFLQELGCLRESDILAGYCREIEPGDITNREGHAAKVYFNALFGMDFTRSEDNIINSALNYGYSILLSLISREISSRGYLTQIGINHRNIFNHYNLSSDLMEPFRIYVDRYVYSARYSQFETSEKHDMLKLLETEVVVRNRNYVFLNAVEKYVLSVFRCLEEKDISELHFPKTQKENSHDRPISADAGNV